MDNEARFNVLLHRLEQAVERVEDLGGHQQPPRPHADGPPAEADAAGAAGAGLPPRDGGFGAYAHAPRKPVDSDWVKTVLGTRDNDLRGHQIALTYHAIAQELDEWIFGGDAFEKCVGRRRRPGHVNVNWFAFATWATTSISRNIRSETPTRIDQLLPGGLRQAATPFVVGVKSGNDQGVNRSLAWGQRAVFASTAQLWVGFRDKVAVREEAGEKLTASAEIEKVLEEVIGETTAAEDTKYNERETVKEHRHLRVLVRAFGAYALARTLWSMRRPDDKQSQERNRGLEMLVARCVLYANVVITAVEQDVVNPAVHATVSHLPHLFIREATKRVARVASLATGVPEAIVSFQLPFQHENGIRAVEAAWARMMTDQILVMSLPTETLRLGRDIPPRRLGRPMYPHALRRLDDKPEEQDIRRVAGDQADAVINVLDDLEAMVSSFDRSRGRGYGTAAWDWRRYDERMNWASALLRSRQNDPTLFWAPYTEDDEHRIRRGQMPARSGDPSRFEVQARLDPGVEEGA